MTIHDEYNIALKNIKSQLNVGYLNVINTLNWYEIEILRKAIEEFEKNHCKDIKRKSLMKRDSKYGKN